MKASINFQKAKSNSISHMSRDSFVSYLIEHDSNKCEYKNYIDSDKYLLLAKMKTKSITKRNMQKLAVDNFVQEAVLNIKADTKIEEIENLFKKFSETEFQIKDNIQKGGFKVFDIALHKDEGVFIDTKYNVNKLIFDSNTLKIYHDKKDVTNEVISLAPNKDIFYNEDNKKWYKEKTFKTEIDTDKLQKKMNYHAHIRFTKWDETTGKNIRLHKTHLNKIQDITADEMGMERGQKNSRAKRMNHYQRKELHQVDNINKKENIQTIKKLNKQTAKKEELKVEKKELKATTKDLQSEIKTLRKDLSGQGLSKEDFKKVNELNKELKEKIKSKDLSIDTLEIRLKKLKEELLLQKDKKQSFQKALQKIKPGAKNNTEVVKYVSELKKELINARETILTLEASNESLKSDLSVSQSSVSVLEVDYQELKEKFEELEKEFEIKLAEKINEYKKEKEEPVVTNQEFLEAAAKVAKRNKKQTNSQEQTR